MPPSTSVLGRRAAAFVLPYFRPPASLTIRQTSHRQTISHRDLTARPNRIRCCAATGAPVATNPNPPSVKPASGVDGRPNIIDVLESRGLFDASTSDPDALRELCAKPVGVYSGFDPTADSLHLGNLLAILALAWFQRCGHRVYALVGGATGKIGDPSGKSAERPAMADETIANNLAGIEANLRQVLDRSAREMKAAGDDGIQEPVVVNNNDWVAPMSFLDFLRDVGKYARVNTMMNKDSVKTRLASEEGMSFTEFTYQLLQAYDFMHLSDKHDVSFQLGGSDQWGNITAGTELTRKLKSRIVHGVTFPLLTTSDGKKFGKSEKGAVWLTPDKLSPYEFYQFLVRTPDDDVIPFLKRLTFMPLDEIDRIAEEMQRPDYTQNSAQKRLAEEVTRMVHGEKGVVSALAATAAAAPGSKAVLSVEALEAISADMPSATMTRADVVGGGILDLMVQSGLQKSKGEARRLIKGGGAYLNNGKITTEKLSISEEDLVGGKLILLAAGKKNKLVVRVE
ncbi:tyrosine--tRNA ligase, mitochondrial or chloroplast [Chondrus crispus]|uniref:Tyrosine--tRNA ligase n=1 Tax=Chondrus crispus TaxID=2769 RepID=R7Q757_CHOCR|nr:tyrosine--tRNA ligase, mitochondrial or chloroplast [Chondrus crispus]CDF33216.1 tyrosine--tRNA ligase, mitochondrial or chloroplast [Chondrus crispus]|eukprot:XP_005713019.1 tyrosine--tRNA ligase, mitochondrial or chloroplast [Chondrus crispus]